MCAPISFLSRPFPSLPSGGSGMVAAHSAFFIFVEEKGMLIFISVD